MYARARHGGDLTTGLCSVAIEKHHRVSGLEAARAACMAAFLLGKHHVRVAEIGNVKPCLGHAGIIGAPLKGDNEAAQHHDR